MLTIKDLFRFEPLDLVRSTVLAVEGYIHDIQFAMDQKHSALIGITFPVQDFRGDEQGKLVFAPQHQTTISLDLISMVAYQGMTTMLGQLLALFTTGNPETTRVQRIESLSRALCLSLLNEQLSTAKLLLSKGADPCGWSYTNGLHAAARAWFRDMILEFILIWKIDPDCNDAHDATPAV
jgi:hypothetical protein